MSSTLGGPPPQDEAAKVLPPEPALDSEKEANGHEEVDLKSRSVQLSPSAASTDPGLTDEAEPHANGSYIVNGESTPVVANTAPQKAEEDSTIGKQSAIDESGPSTTSHTENAHQIDSKSHLTSNDKESTTQEPSLTVQGTSEMEGEPVAESRAVYVTSQSTGASTPSATGDNNNKTQDDITQTPPMHIPPRRRVKVYALSAKTGAWDDRGTGCVDIRAWDTDPELCVISELDPSVPLLESPILADTAYHVQQESLIVWNEPREGSRDGIDLAISFQENQGCSEIWERIMDIQQRLGRNGRSHRLGGSGLGSLDDGVDDLFCKSDDEEDDYPPAALRLPPAKPKHVQEILQVVAHNFLVAKKRLISAILRQNYVESLCDLFKMCEDLGDLNDLHKLFDIFRTLVMLHHPRVLDRLFVAENVFQVMGALEYDPELIRRPRHRHFLENVVVFHQVVNLPQTILDQIHRSFRIQYMKDVVLPRILDETTFTFLNSMIMYANSKIAIEIKTDENILKELFERMKSAETSPELLKDHLRFLNELCEISKHLDQDQKASFYAALHDYGLLEVLQRTLAYSEMSMLSVEILLASIDTDGRQLRKYLLKNKEGGLLALLITRLHDDEDTGVKNVVTDLLRFVVDVDAADDATDREQFLNMFYHNHLDRLLSPILIHTPEHTSKTLSDALGVLIRNLIDFVGFLLMHHGTRARNHIVTYKILSRMNPLIGYVDKHVSLAAVRNLRLVISLKDVVLNRVILKEHLVDRVVSLFLANASRYNLINSSCLDLFNQIKKDGHTPMISYFAHRYYDQLKHITYTDLFVQFKGVSDELKFQNGPGGYQSGHGGGLDMDALLNDDLPETPPLASYGLGRHASSRENDKFNSDMDEMEYFESGDDEVIDSGVGASSTLGDDPNSSYVDYAPRHGLVSVESREHKRHSAAPEVHVPEEGLSDPSLAPASSGTLDHSPLSHAPLTPLINTSYRSHSDEEQLEAPIGPASVAPQPPSLADSSSPSESTSLPHTATPRFDGSEEAPATTTAEPSSHHDSDAPLLSSEPSSNHDTVHKKRKSPSLESPVYDENADVTPLNKRPKAAEDAVDTHS